MNFEEATTELTRFGLFAEIAKPKQSSSKNNPIIQGRIKQEIEPPYFTISKHDTTFVFQETSEHFVRIRIITDTLDDTCQVANLIYKAPNVFHKDFVFSPQHISRLKSVGLHSSSALINNKNSTSFFVAEVNMPIENIVDKFQHGNAEEMLEAEGQLYQTYEIYNRHGLILVEDHTSGLSYNMVFCSNDLTKIVDVLCNYHQKKGKSFPIGKYL